MQLWSKFVINNADTNQNSSCLSFLSCWQACGHRYVKKLLGVEEQQRMVGKCYVRGNDLTYDPTDYWQSDTYELCDFNYDQNLEGMCNMGISGGMTENDVFFGTPGSFVWQGE